MRTRIEPSVDVTTLSTPGTKLPSPLTTESSGRVTSMRTTHDDAYPLPDICTVDSGG